MCVVSEHQDWFRDPHVIRHFDRLIDDGFLDQFNDVIFCGCYAGGYAAAAYSVSYPMATVIAINPQATLNPASHRGTNASNTHGDKISQHDLDMPPKCVKVPRIFLSFMTRKAPKMRCTQPCFKGTMSLICAAS